MNIETIIAIIFVSGIISVMLMSARNGKTEDLHNLQEKCRHDWSVNEFQGNVLQCLKCDYKAGG